MTLIELNDEPIVVHATSGWFNIKPDYLTSFRGLVFYARAPQPMAVPSHAMVVEAQMVWVPA